MKNKIALIGAGNIGGTMAHLIALKKMGDVVIFDVNEGVAKGKALDIAQSSAIEHFDLSIKGTSNYADIKDADVVIVSAGFARKPGMSRDDLLVKNAGVMKQVAEGIRQYAPNAFVIVITNPLDLMVAEVQEKSGLPANKVVGMAGVLDSSRLRLFLAEALNVVPDEVNAFVLGGHGDTMVSMIRYASVGGVSIQELIDMGRITKEQVDQIIARTADGGAEVVKLLQTGSAFFTPASSALLMAEAYLRDSKRVLPCSVKLNGEYGYKDIYVGVPVVIGKNGVEQIIEVHMNNEEKEKFQISCGKILEMKKQAAQILGK